jgi:cytochrome P450
VHGLAKVKYPPGPSGQPFLGSLLQARRDPLQFTLDLCRDYGDIVRFRIGMYYGYLINHPEYYRHVLITNQKNYDKQNYNYRKLRPVLGEGLITADGAQWRRIRCVIQPAFHAHRIRQLESQITRATEEMLDGWDERTTRGRPVAADEEMMKLAFRLISEALFSADLQDATEVVRKAFGVLNRDISWRFKHVWAPPLWMPVPRNIVFRRAQHTGRHAQHAPAGDG